MASELRGVRTSGREMIVTRVLDAPRELVFEAWSRPEHLARWWGPRGFTTTTRGMEFKAGGVWRLCMHGPDGRDYENQINYVEIVRPERIVYRHGGDIDHGPVHFDVTVTFEDVGGKTRLTMRSVLPSAEVLAHVVREYGALEGAMQTIDRLTEELASDAAKGEAGMFAISRVLDAPRERVFEVWTREEHLAKWFGPKGFEITTSRLELRVGGVYHYCMRGPTSPGSGGDSGGGWEMWGKWVFREISPPERLVFVSGFSDPAGETARSPFPGPWPLETLSVVTFAKQEGWTVVTVAWRPLEATAEEREAFEKGTESMRKGWTGTFEMLEGYLAGGG